MMDFKKLIKNVSIRENGQNVLIKIGTGLKSYSNIAEIKMLDSKLYFYSSYEHKGELLIGYDEEHFEKAIELFPNAEFEIEVF